MADYTALANELEGFAEGSTSARASLMRDAAKALRTLIAEHERLTARTCERCRWNAGFGAREPIGGHDPSCPISEIMAESRTAPPTSDEREALADIWAVEHGGSAQPDRHVRVGLPLADAILAAGFRRQGPITDAQVEAAARGIFGREQCARHEKDTPERLAEQWQSRLDERDMTEYRAMARAALEAARDAS